MRNMINVAGTIFSFTIKHIRIERDGIKHNRLNVTGSNVPFKFRIEITLQDLTLVR